MRHMHVLLAGVAVAAGAVALAFGHPNRELASAQTAPQIVVGMAPPTDIPVPGGGGAPSATLPQAAAFAWNEFFALNWTALTQDRSGKSLRDTPDPSCPFGKPGCAVNRPRVWQTYRGKVEIFPGNGSPPPSYTTPPPNTPTWSYGYDGGPNYVYSSTVPACPNQSSAPAPWMNLDETDQIGLDSMYAGIGPTPQPNASPGTTNSQPQMIRFVAKANRVLYSYVEGYGFWQAPPGGVPTPGSPDPTPATQPYNGPTPNIVSLPNGTIETKSAWRPLGAGEDSSRFVTSPVRYYEKGPNGVCWRQATFALVALHIIQKTPTAPYFVYATFEQADNLLTAAGQRVEDDNGNVRPMPPIATLPPTTPRTALVDVTAKPVGFPVPPKIVAFGPPCAPIGKRLYYRNTTVLKALPHGPQCVNHRQNPIPADVINANTAAHKVLAQYEAANGNYHSPFEHYKLINVQYKPIDKNVIAPYSGSAPATFSLANIVVETNHTLQLFSGGLVRGDPGTGSNSDFPGLFPNAVPGKTTYKNVYYNSQTYNMGGCMGCHGTAGQLQGGDFSVIMAKGQEGTLAPEFPAPVTGNGSVKQIPRNRGYVNGRIARGTHMMISH